MVWRITPRVAAGGIGANYPIEPVVWADLYKFTVVLLSRTPMLESGGKGPSTLSIESIVRRCRALSPPIRIALLNALRARAATIDELEQTMGSSERDVSEHLNVLVDAGLVIQVPKGDLWRYTLAAGDLLAPCREREWLRRQRRLQAQIAQYIHELAS